MENNEGWIMNYLSLSLQSYGDDKGKMTGSVNFKNGEKMSMTFKVDSVTSQKFLVLIQDEIVKSAKEMGEQLAKSIPIQLTTNDTKELPMG